MNKLIVILCFAFLVSCKGETYKIWSLNNNTTTTIQSKHIDEATQEEVTYTLAPSETVLLKKVTLKGSDYETGNPGSVFSKWIITNAAGDTCLKNYQVTENWNIRENSNTPPKKTYFSYDFNVSTIDF